jgi:hypothetical protein
MTVNSLSEKPMREKPIANRKDRYASILWLGSGPDKSDVERLSDAEAFGTLALSRRLKSAAEGLPLFDEVSHVQSTPRFFGNRLQSTNRPPAISQFLPATDDQKNVKRRG